MCLRLRAKVRTDNGLQQHNETSCQSLIECVWTSGDAARGDTSIHSLHQIMLIKNPVKNFTAAKNNFNIVKGFIPVLTNPLL